MTHFTTGPALISAAVSALSGALGKVPRWHGYEEGYVAAPEDNLLSPDLLARFREQFGNGAGGELKERRRGGKRLPPKMHAVRSSSALALNAFGPWDECLARLVLGSHARFETLRFECPLAAVPGRRPPHLDVLLCGERGIVAVEMKCLEYLSPPKNEFADAYRAIADRRRESPWFRHMGKIDASTYKHLHAAQLIKHYFGLAKLREDTALPITLVYLYWVPTNRDEITVAGSNGATNPFEKHREEVERFKEAVRGDEATRIGFEHMTTDELFAQWDAVEVPSGVKQSIASLRRRYDVAIGAQR